MLLQGGAMSERDDDRLDAWPDLNFGDGKETIETLQLWTQIVGKIRLAQTP